MSGCNPQNERIEQLFREMFKTLYIYAKNALGEHSLAEDATQETFCTACAKSDECLQSGNPEGWLMKTLKNVVRNTKRQRAKLNMLAVISLRSCTNRLKPF
jgi:DNA-directed RNA polymerase specialized sigma24 family protein